MIDHNSALKRLSLLVKNSIIGGALSYALTTALARTFGPDTFGYYSYILILGGIMSTLVSFSTENTGPVEFSRSGNLKATAQSIYALRVALFLCATGVLAIIYRFDLTIVFGVLAVSLASLNLGLIYDCDGRFVTFSYLQLVERMLYVAAAFLLILTGFADVVSVFLAYLVFSLLSLSVQWWAHRALFQGMSSVAPGEVFRLLKENAALTFTNFAVLGLGGFSRLILESRRGFALLGIYSAAWQLTMIATLFQSQVSRLWRVSLSSAVVTADRSALRKSLKSYILLTTLPMVGFSIVTALFAPHLTALLFGQQYEAVAEILPIFSMYYPIVNLDGLAAILWIASGRRFEYMIVMTIASVLLLGSFWLIPQHLDLSYYAGALVLCHGAAVAVLLIRFSCTAPAHQRAVLPDGALDQIDVTKSAI
jgi:O-antigen/teichoic acid export membrane protein